MTQLNNDNGHILVERLLKDYQSRIPARVNLVDIIGANENAHTRILAAILGYKRAGKMPFVQSFVERFIRNEDGTARISIGNPHVEIQRNYIDALLWEPTRYAIVVENKINWAVDQEKQLETYINATRGICDIDPASQCYVIYLTDDGQKKVSEISLTATAKKFLEYENEDNPGRFIELNYREDILLWLKEDVLANCRYAEQTLMSMLQQYIDCLEYRFGLGHDDAEVHFLETHLRGSELEKYTQLKQWEGHCRAKDSFEDIPPETVEDLAAQVRNAMRQMLKHNYSLNWADAAVSKGETIRNWAREHDFQPRKWYNDTFFEFRVEPSRERIKFQINLDNRSDKVWVQFFNNDFKPDGQHRVLSDFGNLVPLFRQKFAASESSSAANEEWALLGVFSTEKELLTVLNGPVKDFLDAFCAEFQPKGSSGA